MEEYASWLMSISIAVADDACGLRPPEVRCAVVGCMLVGRPYDEATLYRLAAAIETS